MGVNTRIFSVDVPVGMSTIKLDSKGGATVQYTVKNVSGLPKDGRAVLLSIPQTNPPKGAVENNWIKIDGATDRHFAPDQEEVFNVKIAALPQDKPNCQPGNYSFRLDVVDIAKPDVGDSARPLQFEVVKAAVKPMPKWPILVAVIALVVIGGGVAAWLLTRGIKVPDLTGKTVAEATQELANSKLTVDQNNVKENESTPENSGKVIDQNPKGGTNAKSGSAIEITIGAQRIHMPTLTGHTLAEAQTIINQNGLGAPTITIAASPTYASGVVWDQTPQPGDTTKSGAAVTLKVTPQTVPVPIVTGMPFTQAYQTLQRAGLATGNTTGDINQHVASQNPTTGVVAVGTKVDLNFPCAPGVLCVTFNPGLLQRIYQDKMRVMSPALRR